MRPDGPGCGWRRAVLALFVGLALVYLWPLTLRPGWVPFKPGAPYTDLLIAHWPNSVYLRDSLARYGQLPLWNAQQFAGQPFVADPLAGVWYPPNLLLLVLPLPLAYNLLLAAHVAGSGLGLYRLLRAEGLDFGPALLGGLAFAGTPKLVAHAGAGHVSLVFAVAWTPWLLLAARRAAEAGGVWRGALAGATVALTFLADVRWSLFAGGLGLAYWLVALRGARAASQQPRLSARLAAAGAAVLFAALLGAGLAVPLLEFIGLSSRAQLTLAEAGAFSLPPWPYLLGLLIPDLGGFHEWMTYVGVLPLLLAVIGAASAPLRRGAWLWAGAALFAGLFALGTYFPLFPLVYRLLPGVSWLRVPARAWFIVALALCALAAHGAQFLLAAIWPRLRARYAARSLRLPAGGTLLAALALLTALDLLRVDSTLLEARPLPALAPAAAWLLAQPGLFRVYSPSYSLPPGDGLQHLDGVNPLQLAEPARSIQAAIGVAAPGYSVTIPAFVGEDLATANAAAVPDAALLGRLNVKYVAAEFDLEAPGLALVQSFDRTRIYVNDQFRPRAWMEGSVQPAQIAAWTPNRIEVEATGPGQLVLSEIAYPGWRASINGRRVPLETAGGVLRAVSLPPGIQHVVLEFRPGSVFAGAALSALGVVLLAGLAWRERARGRGLGR